MTHEHDHDCPAYYRPSVAAAIRDAVQAERERVLALVEKWRGTPSQYYLVFEICAAELEALLKGQP